MDLNHPEERDLTRKWRIKRLGKQLQSGCAASSPEAKRVGDQTKSPGEPVCVSQLDACAD